MQNKQRLELADYEAENLARLQKTFSRKWEFIFMQAEAQAKSVAHPLCGRCADADFVKYMLHSSHHHRHHKYLQCPYFYCTMNADAFHKSNKEN